MNQPVLKPLTLATPEIMTQDKWVYHRSRHLHSHRRGPGYHTRSQLHSGPGSPSSQSFPPSLYISAAQARSMLQVPLQQVHPASAPSRSTPVHQGHREHSQHEMEVLYLEALFGSLRGETLLLAALAYGLRVRLSALTAVRVRDVGIFDGTILVAGREQCVPDGIVEDIREFLQERVCGCEAPMVSSDRLVSSEVRRPCSIGHYPLRNRRAELSPIDATKQGPSSGRSSIRDEKLFSSSAHNELVTRLEEIGQLVIKRFQTIDQQLHMACFDSRLRMLGWLHRRRALSKGTRTSSPLDLFDKGPRIVRRKSGGIIDAYYLWRASRTISY